MSLDTFYQNTREVLYRMLSETPKADRNELVDAYAEILTRLHAAESHQMLTDVLDDARTRLNARLSPDPISQGIANVQVTVQDLWRSLWE